MLRRAICNPIIIGGYKDNIIRSLYIRGYG